jgi:hypothetical protein
VAALGALLVLLFLPARARQRAEGPGELQPAQPEPVQTRG